MGKNRSDDSPSERLARILLGVGDDVEIRQLDLSDLDDRDPAYLDIVLATKDGDMAYNFVAENGDDRQYGYLVANALLELKRYGVLRNPALRNVWVGDDLPQYSGTLDMGGCGVWYQVFDLRDLGSMKHEYFKGEKQFLRQLLAVHTAHPGLFKRLLSLPPEEHQKEFYKIAQGLGYHTVDLDEHQRAVVERMAKKAAAKKAPS
jgi:hypothetical protein